VNSIRGAATRAPDDSHFVSQTQNAPKAIANIDKAIPMPRMIRPGSGGGKASKMCQGLPASRSRTSREMSTEAFSPGGGPHRPRARGRWRAESPPVRLPSTCRRHRDDIAAALL
jgi:hypothetical protein